MQLLELTLPRAAENLALDESLLDEAEAFAVAHDNANPGAEVASGEHLHRQAECLRLWELPEPVVIVGRSSQIAREVHAAACRRRNIPILRRDSGGAAIVAGPGCLMYSLVLSYRLRPELRAIEVAHRFVLNRLVECLAMRMDGIACRGTSDLVRNESKVSGNSMRAKREFFLYHGTLLYDFPLELIAECLQMPPRQPDYRMGRAHQQFVANLPCARGELEASLRAAWQPLETTRDWPRDRVARLTRERHALESWQYCL